MEKPRFKIIENRKEYNTYCNLHEKMCFDDEIKYKNEIELLELLISDYDKKHSRLANLEDVNPVELIKLFMEEHEMNAQKLSEILQISKGTVSKMMNYKKGISKNSIRILADYFKISQSALNRNYKLDTETRALEMV